MSHMLNSVSFHRSLQTATRERCISRSHFLLHLAAVEDEDAVVDGDGRLRQVRRDHDLPHPRLRFPVPPQDSDIVSDVLHQEKNIWL